MSNELLAWSLLISLCGSLLSGLLALLPIARAHRLSHGVLALSTIFGAFAAIMVATGDGTPVLLPASLSGAVEAGASPKVWPLFYGMVFGLDRFSAIFYSLITVVAGIVAVYAIPYLEAYADTYNLRSVSFLTAVFVFGMQGVVLSTNIIGFVTFWMIMVATSFFLVLADGSEASRKAGFLYLIMAHLGAGAITAGWFLLSGGALLSDFSLLAMVTPQLPQTTLHIASVLLLLGFGSGAGLAPFHAWLPEASAQSPSPVSALMSGLMLNVAVYGFLRVLLFMLPGVPGWFVATIIILGIISAVIGVQYAVLERDLKRLLAYSSMQHTGLLFCMLGVGLLAGREGNIDLTQAALYAVLFLVVAHGIFKPGLFLGAGTLIARLRTCDLEVMGGLGKRMPKLSLAVCVLVVTAAALPPFAPFVAQWTFWQAMVGALPDATPILKVTLVCALSFMAFVAGLSVFAMVKLYAFVFLAQPRSEAAEQAQEPSGLWLWPVAGLAILGTILGVLAPRVLSALGAGALTPVPEAPAAAVKAAIVTGGGSLMPLAVGLAMFGLGVGLYLLRSLITNVEFERRISTWNGGQPLTPRMEYTSTGFSAPIRFFFRFISRSQKLVTATPVISSNPWIASRSMILDDRRVWYERFYRPLGWLLHKGSAVASRIQNGSIQFYVTLILLALLTTLIVAL
jgi:hydrogenase-4 component B